MKIFNLFTLSSLATFKPAIKASYFALLLEASKAKWRAHSTMIPSKLVKIRLAPHPYELDASSTYRIHAGLAFDSLDIFEVGLS